MSYNGSQHGRRLLRLHTARTNGAPAAVGRCRPPLLSFEAHLPVKTNSAVFIVPHLAIGKANTVGNTRKMEIAKQAVLVARYEQTFVIASK